MLSDVPSRVIHKPGRVAVLLNARAKRWTGELHEAVSRWVPSRDLYLTDDFRQAEKTVDRLLASGEYEFLFTGGGDGTIVYLMNAIEERIREDRIDRKAAPPVGVLRMGTGNAIATYLGCRDVVEDLRAVSGGSPLVVYSVDMVESGGELCPFAGFGWDAQVLNDYDSFKESVRDTALENSATGLAGYAASIVTRSIPSALGARPKEVRITSLGGHAVRITQAGEIVDDYLPGDVMFEGPTSVFGASTIPYWGFGVRMFPHCTRLPRHFQLRAYSGSMSAVLTHLPRFWKGEFAQGEMADFLAQHVKVEILDGAMAYHVAGDPGGFEREVEWKISEHPAQLAVPLPQSF